jgi:pilus assembly protein CpaF
MIARIETMVMMRGGMPLSPIRSQIASALRPIVQQSAARRHARGTIIRRSRHGWHVFSMPGYITFETDGSLDGQAINGRFRATGVYPKCASKIRSNGVAVHDEWFS